MIAIMDTVMGIFFVMTREVDGRDLIEDWRRRTFGYVMTDERSLEDSKSPFTSMSEPMLRLIDAFSELHIESSIHKPSFDRFPSGDLDPSLWSRFGSCYDFPTSSKFDDHIIIV
jgi:hypothetical protein